MVILRPTRWDTDRRARSVSALKERQTGGSGEDTERVRLVSATCSRGPKSGIYLGLNWVRADKKTNTRPFVAPRWVAFLVRADPYERRRTKKGQMGRAVGVALMTGVWVYVQICSL